ncbi:MAG TPA: alpha/beta-type small acid-soluble spore protein [Clostridia bacterium]|nr:alpha/beta-type small acid-soluble spore protein [Clostridia bacterium]
MAQFVEPKVLPTDVLDSFKYEIADELGLTDKIRDIGWPNMPSRECGRIGGKIGGNIVKVMIRHMERQLTNRPVFAQE